MWHTDTESCMARALIYLLLQLATLQANTEHLRISSPHASYICPVGSNVRMECVSEGSLVQANDRLQRLWFFTPHQAAHCDSVHPRAHHNHSSHAPPPASVQSGSEPGGTFWISLQNVSAADQGRYCCVGQDQQFEQHHRKVVQKAHSYVLLTVTPRQNGSSKCVVVDHKGPEGTISAGLATAGCIMGILSLPLILLLVYKQRQTAEASQRAQELVRMDSEAQGHENPVFLNEGPPQRTRTVSQILMRQPSETGRHLLSDPGSPLSPYGPGDAFFPAYDFIREAHNIPQV